MPCLASPVGEATPAGIQQQPLRYCNVRFRIVDRSTGPTCLPSTSFPVPSRVLEEPLVRSPWLFEVGIWVTSTLTPDRMQRPVHPSAREVLSHKWAPPRHSFLKFVLASTDLLDSEIPKLLSSKKLDLLR